MNLICTCSWCVLLSQIGSMLWISPKFRTMFIMLLIRLGASFTLVQSVAHLITIVTIMNPNRDSKNNNWGKNSKNSVNQSWKWMLLIALIRIPNTMCSTPKITANFILNELKKSNSFWEMNQIGSKPNG